MTHPTPAEVAAIKADARRRYGSERAMIVPFAAPVDAAIVVAPFDLKGFCAHVDARAREVTTAQACAVVDRLLWCSPMVPDEWSAGVDQIVASKEDPDPLRRVALARLELLRDAWPVVDAEVESYLRKAAGQIPGSDFARASPLTPGNAPRGLSAADAAKLLDGAPKLGAGSLWAVSHPGGLALVLRAPQPDAWLAARAAFAEAHGAKSGIVDSTLVLMRQLVVWSPEPFEAMIERQPGYAEALWNPLLDMGGSSAQTSSAFL